jgi:hypothetical protein
MPVGVSAYVPLANVTLGSSSATVTFSSISQLYRDLILVSSVRFSTGGSNGTVEFQFNNDTASNYSWVYMQGNGSSASSGTGSGGIGVVGQGESSSGSIFGNGIAHIFDYSATDKHKTVIARGDTPSTVTQGWASRWANTAAVTTLVIRAPYTFAAGSTFALYGVSA